MSKKIFTFSFAFAGCEWALSFEQRVECKLTKGKKLFIFLNIFVDVLVLTVIVFLVIVAQTEATEENIWRHPCGQQSQ